MTNTALIGQLNVLSYLGLTADILQSIDKTQSTTLRFQASRTCTFLKEEVVEIPEKRVVEEDEQIQTSGSSSTGTTTTTKSTIKQVIKHVTEFHWNVAAKWEISLFSGSDVEQRRILQCRSSNMVLIIQSDKTAPLPEHYQSRPSDVSVTWLMNQVDTLKMASTFSVDRLAPTTMTPRQNKDVESACSMTRELLTWTAHVLEHFRYRIQKEIIWKHKPAGPRQHHNMELEFECRACDAIFIPVQPLMEATGATRDTNETTSKSMISWAAGDTVETGSPLLSSNDVHILLNEHIRSIDEHVANLVKTYPSPTTSQTLVSSLEATIVQMCIHSKALGFGYFECVDFVENMLKRQLVSAIGKNIQPSDIDKFLQYHNATLLNPVPTAFCHPIRQPGYYPCGLLSIESVNKDGDKTPIQTLVREIDASKPTKLSLNSATTVELTGQKFLHGWIHHRFGTEHKKFELIARARQFSAFLLVVGTMVGPDKLDPKEAIIVHNKDECLIPLLLEEIPTSKEFKKAIQSLSPEQQRFAEAFRSMQLDSSVMGICVIQIKPQLEKLLGLPHDALMKEMKLTEDLIQLFMDHQVPSDLFSYDGIDSNPSPREMVDNVRGHAKAILDVIEKERLDILARRAELAAAEERVFDRPGDIRSVPRAGKPILDDEPVQEWARSKSHGNECFRPTKGNCDVTPDWSDVAIDQRPSSTQGDVLQHQTAITGTSNSKDTDVTKIPKILNSKIEELASGVALRSTTLKLGEPWKIRKENFLGEKETLFFDKENEIVRAKNRAFDLLDALSRSGSLPIAFSELHVIVAITHCFEKDVINTIIQDNINPIEKLEMSTLLLGSVLHGVPAGQLIERESDFHRLKSFFPALFENAGAED